MLTRDLLRFSLTSIFHHRMRSFLTALGIAVGIGAVILLTSIGAGLHRYVLSEFTQFGSNIIAINPGKTTTLGTPLGILGSVKPLSIEDAMALESIPIVRASVPFFQGNAQIQAQGKQRRITVIGTSSDMIDAFSMSMSKGQFLPPDDPNAPRALIVLGAKTSQEIFNYQNPVGERVRLGGARYRVIGTLAAKGTFLGFDMDDTVFIPTLRALELFNREGLMEIDVIYHEGNNADEVVTAIKRVLIARHGHEDFTITTQQQMLDVLGSVLNVLTIAVAGLGGISLLVGAIGILTIMTISVSERTSEIGLLRALGAKRAHITLFFLLEAAILSALGGVFGLIIGGGGAQLLGLAVPELPIHTPWEYAFLAEVLAISIGLISGLLPARRAAHMDPVAALRAD